MNVALLNSGMPVLREYQGFRELEKCGKVLNLVNFIMSLVLPLFNKNLLMVPLICLST